MDEVFVPHFLELFCFWLLGLLCGLLCLSEVFLVFLLCHLPEVAWATTLFDDLHSRVLLEVAHRSTHPFSIRHLSYSAVPRRGESSLCVQQAHRDFVFAGGLMDGESQVMWEVVLDGPSKGLPQ